MPSSTREKAMSWWKKLTFEDQFFATINWLIDQKRDTTERHPDHLTGREIQEIYEFENKKSCKNDD